MGRSLGNVACFVWLLRPCCELRVGVWLRGGVLFGFRGAAAGFSLEAFSGWGR